MQSFRRKHVSLFPPRLAIGGVFMSTHVTNMSRDKINGSVVRERCFCMKISRFSLSQSILSLSHETMSPHSVQ